MKIVRMTKNKANKFDKISQLTIYFLQDFVIMNIVNERAFYEKELRMKEEQEAGSI